MGDAVRRWTQGDLSLEMVERNGELRVTWRGTSSEREPSRFLVPVLTAALERAREASLPLVLDFRELEYMNSSTFTPVVKCLDDSRRLGIPVVLEYSLSRKWQSLSFSALRTFETLDGRIKVRGK